MICTKGNSNAANLKIMETFYNGLSDRKKLEMARLNIHSINEICQIIEVTENTMMKQMTDSEQHNPAQKGEKTTKKGEKHTWCEYHKINTHNTNDAELRRNH